METEDPVDAAARLIEEEALVDAVEVLVDQDPPETRAAEVLALLERILAYDVDEDDDEEWIWARAAAEDLAGWARHRVTRPLVARAEALIEAGRGREAERPLREVIAVGPEWDEWFHLGWLLVNLPGRRAEGIEALERALRSPSPDVVANAAVELVMERLLDRDALGARRYAAMAIEQDVDALSKFGGRLLTALGADLESPDVVPPRFLTLSIRFRRWRVGRRLVRAER